MPHLGLWAPAWRDCPPLALGTSAWDRALRRIQILEQGGELAPALPDSPALPAAIKHFLEASQARHLKISTLDSYETSLAHLSASLELSI